MKDRLASIKSTSTDVTSMKTTLGENKDALADLQDKQGRLSLRRNNYCQLWTYKNISTPLGVHHEERGSPPCPGTPGTSTPPPGGPPGGANRLGTLVPVWWLFGSAFEHLSL